MAQFKFTTSLDMARVAQDGISVKIQGDNVERFIGYSNVSGQNIVTFNAPNDSLVRNYVVQITLIGGLQVSSIFSLGCAAPVPIPVVPIPAPSPVAPTPTFIPTPPVPVTPTPTVPVPVESPVAPTPVFVPQPVAPTPTQPPVAPTPATPTPVFVPQPVTPTPVPQPIPVIVPQPVTPIPVQPPVAIICEEWINNTGNDLAIGSYVDCQGFTVPALTLSQSQSICARQGTIQGGELLTYVGVCSETPVPQPIPVPVPQPVPVPVVSSRAILLSNPTSPSANDACLVNTGLTKYILSTFVITNGLEIFNDPELTQRTYVSNPGNFSTVIDGGSKYAVTFDSNGVVSTATLCSPPPPQPIPVPVPQPVPVPIQTKELFITTEQYTTSAEACLAIMADIPVYTTQGTAVTSGIPLYNNAAASGFYTPPSTSSWYLLTDGGLRYAVQVASNGFISNAIPC